MKKKVKVHMLPTDKIVEIRPGYFIDGISKFTSQHPKGGTYLTIIRSMEGMEIPDPQHLYFTSDEKIEEGDWCYRIDTKEIFQAGDTSNFYIGCANTGGISRQFCRKIVATTDTSKKLKVYDYNRPQKYNPSKDIWTGKPKYKHIQLPQIPQSFMEHYVKTGGEIDEVEIEYKEYGHYEMAIDTFNSHGYKPKVDSNNCVIVHFIEEKLYTKEEVKILCKSAFQVQRGYGTFEDWIEENLK